MNLNSSLIQHSNRKCFSSSITLETVQSLSWIAVPKCRPRSMANECELTRKQSWSWWFKTLPRPLWRHGNDARSMWTKEHFHCTDNQHSSNWLRLRDASVITTWLSLFIHALISTDLQNRHWIYVWISNYIQLLYSQQIYIYFFVFLTNVEVFTVNTDWPFLLSSRITGNHSDQ